MPVIIARPFVVVLHDVNMARRFCDDVIALHSGRLIARGGPDELLTPERLQAIYGLNMAVMPHPTPDSSSLSSAEDLRRAPRFGSRRRSPATAIGGCSRSARKC